MLFLLFIWSTILAMIIRLVQWHWKQKAHIEPLSKIPGSKPIFLIGNITWVVGIYSKKLEHHPGVYIMDRIKGSSVLYHKTGMYAFWFGMTPIVSIHRAEILEDILSSSSSLEKSFEYTFLHKWLGTGLLTSTGSKWKTRRKLLTPCFHFRILEDYIPVFHEQSSILMEKLRALANQEFVDITPLIALCTLDIVCETMMGVHVGAQSDSNSEYVRVIHNLGNYFNQRTVRPWLWTDFLFGLTEQGKIFAKDIQTLHNFTEKVIKEKKQKLLDRDLRQPTLDERETKERKTFMDLLLDLHIDGDQLTEEDIREEVDTFMFEGHDTTAMAITFALYCIGLYPEVQKKIAEELDFIFGEDVSRPAIHDDIRNMKYLECVLKESQRLFPSVPAMGRKLAEDIKYKEFTIPKDTTVHFDIIGLHRNPDVFPEPEVFDPDRFLPENCPKRHPYAFIPFSAGPRNCIGQKFALLEEKAIISNILRHFFVRSLDPRDILHTKIEFTLRPAGPVRLKFEPRR